MALQEHTLALVSLAWARALGLPDDGLGTLGTSPATGAASAIGSDSGLSGWKLSLGSVPW